MIGEIIAIGDELTSGRITNTTSGYAARHLFAAGHEIHAMHTIGDSPELIGEALKKAIQRSDFVLVTGGLGSTSDDLTNEAVASALHRPPTLNQDLLKRIRDRLGDTSLETRFEKMAWLPEGSEVLTRESKMAGHMLVHDGVPIFFLPGVPSQMKQLLVEEVLPRLERWRPEHRNHVRQKIFRTFGLPEVEINRRLAEVEKEEHVHIGYYPVDCEVHVSLTVLNRDDGAAEIAFQRAEQAIKHALGNAIYGTGHETLAQAVGSLLAKHNLRLAVAESCTGGLIGKKITDIAGSSAWFAGGVVAYSNRFKELFLDVEDALLLRYGAVSKQVAMAMAARLASRTHSEVAVSVTGIAGPDGGSREKPVGTVYIALFHEQRVQAQRHLFHGNRHVIREYTACTALDTVRRALLVNSS